LPSRKKSKKFWARRVRGTLQARKMKARKCGSEKSQKENFGCSRGKLKRETYSKPGKHKGKGK